MCKDKCGNMASCTKYEYIYRDVNMFWETGVLVEFGTDEYGGGIIWHLVIWACVTRIMHVEPGPQAHIPLPWFQVECGHRL